MIAEETAINDRKIQGKAKWNGNNGQLDWESFVLTKNLTNKTRLFYINMKSYYNSIIDQSIKFIKILKYQSYI